MTEGEGKPLLAAICMLLLVPCLMLCLARVASMGLTGWQALAAYLLSVVLLTLGLYEMCAH